MKPATTGPSAGPAKVATLNIAKALPRSRGFHMSDKRPGELESVELANSPVKNLPTRSAATVEESAGSKPWSVGKLYSLARMRTGS